MLTDFQNSFTVTLARKFAIKTSLQISHLSGFVTLPYIACPIYIYIYDGALLSTIYSRYGHDIWQAATAVTEAVYRWTHQHNRKCTDVNQLKQAIVEECNKLSQRFIDRSIDEWRRRLILGLYSSRVDTVST